MQEFDCDLHYHGPYSVGVSKNMFIPIIAEQAELKGLNLLSSADCLNGKWLQHLKENLVEENGIFKSKEKNVFFVLGTEVQCSNRVHHIIFLPDFNAVEQVRNEFRNYTNELDSVMGGRPRLKLNGEQIAEIVFDAKGLIGPAHAFTPYFGVYAYFDSIKESYGTQGKNISFIELGLSADSFLADKIPENRNYLFLSNSDAHSPWPFRLGREFNRIKLKEPSFKELKKALQEKEEKRIVLNVGLDPKEGKYHRTACQSCYSKYSLDEAERLKWKCVECKKEIKRGVVERIEMLSDGKNSKPDFRPDYLHLLPLQEIIQQTIKIKLITSPKIQFLWKKFVERFGSEIKVLVDEPIEELEKVDGGIAKKIDSFRKGLVLFEEGGGGKYGKPIICENTKEFEQKK
ncbi:TIGR00375 family protein, partial [Candidatus Micrarchaeota archaeon]|nr:TIGR00375 family protein [Candidatus Micrarchaeota archaeon]